MTEGQTPGRSAPMSRRWLAGGVLATFVVSLVVMVWLYSPSPLIYDSDSYYHLAVARDYQELGFDEPLRQVRYGLLSRMLGDKEFLFHALLMPFANGDPEAGDGRWGLALLNAALLATIAFIALQAVGRWGFLVPLWLLFASPEFTWRLVRLRPELLSVTLLLLALWAAGRKRYWLLAGLGTLYALSYTAVHAFVGLFILVFLALGWMRREWDWRLAVLPGVGVALGWLLHPQLPDNIIVWWYQSVEFFRFKGSLDVGTEIQPNTTDVALLVNLGWWLGLWVLWRSSSPGSRPAPEEERLAVAFIVAAGAFGGLYVLMSRFSIYFFPLATLALLLEVRRRGLRLGAKTLLPGRGRVPLAAAFAITLLAAWPVARGELARYRQRMDPGPDRARVGDMQRLAAGVPAGAHVAADWRSTALYVYWLPQAEFLNVLDPMFLAAVDPEVHAAQDQLLSGRSLDAPLLAVTQLESDYLMLSNATGSPRLSAQLRADPRVRELHHGSHSLFRVEPPEVGGWIVDWRVVPPGSEVPPAEVDAAWSAYPRHPDVNGRAVEGYVDARRLLEGEGCLAFTRPWVVEAAGEALFELATSGRSVLWLDDRALIDLRTPSEAPPAGAVRLPVAVTDGDHRLTVLTCSVSETGPAGFYLRRVAV